MSDETKETKKSAGLGLDLPADHADSGVGLYAIQPAGAERFSPGGGGELCGSLLPTVEQGTYLGDARPVQIGDRLKAGQPPLKDQGHKKGLHCVVVVVSQRDFGNSSLSQRGVKRPPAHLGAHGAGIFLPAQVKNDVEILRKSFISLVFFGFLSNALITSDLIFDFYLRKAVLLW